ncbi:hypothetical protein FCM35_KLT09030 [Carex littledalei]|uniref:Uncharacterized protein n=1 Tax=Carex littledalei TaxID=544730 RepID=A0A833VH33_9POAL|nr:hypothetical protein FCM35_KLT09030 [Carex littledalei]
MPRRPRMSSISRTKATPYKALINPPSLVSLEEVEVTEWHESITYMTKNLNFPQGNGEQLINWPYTNQIGSLQSSGGACLHPESSGSADVSVSVESINKVQQYISSVHCPVEIQSYCFSLYSRGTQD